MPKDKNAKDLRWRRRNNNHYPLRKPRTHDRYLRHVASMWPDGSESHCLFLPTKVIKVKPRPTSPVQDMKDEEFHHKPASLQVDLRSYMCVKPQSASSSSRDVQGSMQDHVPDDLDLDELERLLEEMIDESLSSINDADPDPLNDLTNTKYCIKIDLSCRPPVTPGPSKRSRH